MGPVPRAMAFKKEKTKTLGSGLGPKFRSCQVICFSEKWYFNVQFFFFLSFLARRIGRSLEPTSFFFLSFLGVGFASPMNKLCTWGSWERSLESRARKERQVREVGKERRALLFLRPSWLRRSLARSLATRSGEPAGRLPESIQFSLIRSLIFV